MDEIRYNEEISVPMPFGVNRAFPLDSRSFFSDIEDAREAVRYAVRLEREHDTGYLTLPSEEMGGANSPYYFGQPVAVSEGDGSTATLYLVVKATDEHGDEYGELVDVCHGLNSEYLKKDEAPDYIAAYIHEHLNTDCIDGYLFTGAVDECGHTIDSTGLYAFGLKEVDGVLQKCDDAEKVLSFDPSTPYDKKTNPLATMNTVRRALAGKVDVKPGYGLSQNDLTDCLMQKLANMPSITIEGDKLTINGKSYKLQEWYEVFDYYVGWLNLNRRGRFLELSKEELLDAVRNSGTVPPEGKLYGKDAACGYNTFFVMKRKNINIDGSVHGEFSEWESGGLTSPIRTYVPSVMQHNDVMVNDMMYDVYGLHTHHPNPSDTVQIAFNVTLFDYYVGWMRIEKREDFYTKTKDDLISHAEFANFDGEYYVYEHDYLDYNLFYVMVKEGVGFDSPVMIDGEEDSSHMSSFHEYNGEQYGLDSPIRSDVPSVMEHDSVVIDGVTYRVYGVHTHRPNSTDKVHIVFSK